MVFYCKNKEGQDIAFVYVRKIPCSKHKYEDDGREHIRLSGGKQYCPNGYVGLMGGLLGQKDYPKTDIVLICKKCNELHGLRTYYHGTLVSIYDAIKKELTTDHPENYIPYSFQMYRDW
jgi:hypothetical protein